MKVGDFWSDSRSVVAFYWGVLAPFIEQERTTSADPTIYRWFEWLELEMRRIDLRQLGRSRTFDPAMRASAIADRIAVLRARLDRERESWAGGDDAYEPTAVSQPTATDAEDVGRQRQ